MAHKNIPIIAGALAAFGITFLSYQGYVALAQFVGPGTCPAGQCSGAISVNSNNNIGFGMSATTTARLFVAASTTPGSYAIMASGTIYSTAGGFQFPDGTTQVSASVTNGGTASTTAENVKAGSFGANWSGGNYSFPGSLGIGTTTPSMKLTVSGTGQVFGIDNTAILAAKNAAGVYESYLWPRWNDNIMYTNFGSSGWNIRNNGSTNVMFLQPGGNVGIGTASPSEKLHVQGGASITGSGYSVSGNVIIYGDGTLGPYLAGNTDSAGNSTVTAAGMRLQLGNSGLVVGSSPSTAAGSARTFTNRVTIDTSGNVGIGTTPQAPLHVSYSAANSGAGTPALIVDNPSGGSQTVLSLRTNNVGKGNIRADSSGNFVLEAGGGTLYLGYTDLTGVGAINFNNGQMYITSGGSVGIGTTGPSYKLDVVSGGATTARFGTASTDKVVVGGGSGKITVGTVDPVYTIGGTRYATYLPGMTGQKEETTGNIRCPVSNNQCAYMIDFNKLEKGNDLWLFAKATDLTKHFGDMAVLLTPAFDGKAWYEKDPKSLHLILHASLDPRSSPSDSQVLEISYRLTAPRFDGATWTNLAEPGQDAGFNLDKSAID